MHVHTPQWVWSACKSKILYAQDPNRHPPPLSFNQLTHYRSPPPFSGRKRLAARTGEFRT